jgi:hypothetical protein
MRRSAIAIAIALLLVIAITPVFAASGAPDWAIDGAGHESEECSGGDDLDGAKTGAEA